MTVLVLFFIGRNYRNYRNSWKSPKFVLFFAFRVHTQPIMLNSVGLRLKFTNETVNIMITMTKQFVFKLIFTIAIDVIISLSSNFKLYRNKFNRIFFSIGFLSTKKNRSIHWSSHQISIKNVVVAAILAQIAFVSMTECNLLTLS